MPPSRRQASLSQLGEFQLIQSISRGFSRGGIRPTVGIGDDAAVLALPSPTQIVISTDLMIEHIHFNRTTSTFYDIGYKAAAVNLSDIAAMGATPTSILVAIALPPHLNHQDWKELYRGLAVPCKAQKVQLIGGDTSSSPSVLFIAITILGRIKPGQSLTRSGAKAGDIIYVSGTLGDSAAGLEYLNHQKHPVKVSTLPQPIKFLVRRHLQPTPRFCFGSLGPFRRTFWRLDTSMPAKPGGCPDSPFTYSSFHPHGHLCSPKKHAALYLGASWRGRLRITLYGTSNLPSAFGTSRQNTPFANYRHWRRSTSPRWHSYRRF